MKVLKTIFREIGKLFTDTLKDKNGRYSRTSLTMFTSFIIATYMAIYELLKKGFNFDVFLIYMCVASGIKIADAFSKRINIGGAGSEQLPPDVINEGDIERP